MNDSHQQTFIEAALHSRVSSAESDVDEAGEGDEEVVVVFQNTEFTGDGQGPLSDNGILVGSPPDVSGGSHSAR